jgi:hypothetical protein
MLTLADAHAIARHAARIPAATRRRSGFPTRQKTRSGCDLGNTVHREEDGIFR